MVVVNVSIESEDGVGSCSGDSEDCVTGGGVRMMVAVVVVLEGGMMVMMVERMMVTVVLLVFGKPFRSL